MKSQRFLSPSALIGLLASLMLLLLPAPSQAADLHVANGETQPLTGDQIFDDVTIDAGGTLVLNGNLEFNCSRLTLGGKIIISGDTVFNILYGDTYPESDEWAMRLVPDEALNLYRPSIDVDYGSDANDGASGNPGGVGDPGVDGYELTINVHGNLVIESTEERATQFRIYLNGQHGGDGGNASGGGSGGDGGSGGKGGTINLTVSKNITASPYGVLIWEANGGNGGPGGADASETTGGGGGTGGQAARGGIIEVNAAYIDPVVYAASFEVNGGNSYFGGGAYNHDDPGLCMPGGAGGQITMEFQSDLLPPFRWSMYANGGNAYICGTCSITICGGWSAQCVCNELNNWTGQGGNGGRIDVTARDIDILSFYANGGNGGNGLGAQNMSCAYDGTNCTWGYYEGSQIGNGGDGASGGNGGVVSVISKTHSVGDDVTYELNGGLGGEGGSGGRPGCSGAVKTCCAICPSGLDGSNGAPGGQGSFRVKRMGGIVPPNYLLFQQ